MKKLLNIYKPLGATPLAAIEEFRRQNPEYKNIKLGYAGRLDPLAEGVLLVLVGNELKNQKKYWGLDKEYEAEVLFGFTTDTYDILGIPRMSQLSIFPAKRDPGTRDNYQFSKDNLEIKLKDLVGSFNFEYPPYSSRTVNGKPLFWYARRNKLSEIKIPRKKIEIYNIELLNTREISGEDLEKIILERVNLVKGDFRQKQIKTVWKKVLKSNSDIDFFVLKLKINASSGTYIRTIAHELGKKLGTGAILLHLKRTKVGEFNASHTLRYTAEGRGSKRGRTRK